uniref:HECT domain-containing protein n=1 Tax=Knipowitschia caucasica TaxID=637954 RepID=A0AAV2LPC8_KNICA
MEEVFKAATFEITRLVEDIFLVEVKQCREQVCTLKRRLKLAESKRKRREAADNRGCRNCGCANAGQPQVSNEKAVNVQTEISVKQEQEMPEEVKYEMKSPMASPSKQQDSSDIRNLINVVKMESNEDEPSVGPSRQVIEPEFQSSWKTQFDQKSTYQQDNEKEQEVTITSKAILESIKWPDSEKRDDSDSDNDVPVETVSVTTGFLRTFIEQASSDHLRQLLKFWIGWEVPVGRLKLQVVKSRGMNHLPTSSTCFERLRIPNHYKTYQAFKADIMACLESVESGFGLV